jgi:UDPglucose 6-dehydrogenase
MGMSGHDVMGWDVNPERMTYDPKPEKEAGPDGTGDFNTHLTPANIKFGPNLTTLVDHSEILFLAIQTPHDPEYEGVTPMPPTRQDFDYDFLRDAVQAVADVAVKDITLVIISTVLPGTIDREIRPILRDRPHIHLVYNPFFIAMGTVMRDFLRPEFVLLGVDDYDSKEVERVIDFYTGVYGGLPPIEAMSIPSAELTKVAYNTFISMKIGFVNHLMEICHAFPGADVDDVTNALKKANVRLISPAYLTAGMGDGGGCHPRDNIAMSWLAATLNLSTDFCGAMMMVRQRQAFWKASIVVEAARKHRLPVVLLGRAFKPETDLETGSPALLVGHYIRQLGWPLKPDDNTPAVYFIGCRKPEYANRVYPQGSVVIDPHRFVLQRPGFTVVRLGEGGAA